MDAVAVPVEEEYLCVEAVAAMVGLVFQAVEAAQSEAGDRREAGEAAHWFQEVLAAAEVQLVVGADDIASPARSLLPSQPNI